MYVCICGGVTEDDIKQAVQDGCACLEDVQEQCFVAYCCKLCKPQAEEIIAQSTALLTTP